MGRIIKGETKKGFTLVELVVVAPLIILLIGGVVATIIQTTNSTIVMQARSQLQLDVLTALDRVEADVRNALVINKTAGSSTLMMSNVATDRNPLSSERKLIRQSDCSVASGGLSIDDVLKYRIRYYTGSNTLRRETMLDGCTTSNNVWQNHNDSEDLIKNADSVTINVSYDNYYSLEPTTVVDVTISASRQVAGRTINYSSSVHAESLNME